LSSKPDLGLIIQVSHSVGIMLQRYVYQFIFYIYRGRDGEGVSERTGMLGAEPPPLKISGYATVEFCMFVLAAFL